MLCCIFDYFYFFIFSRDGSERWWPEQPTCFSHLCPATERRGVNLRWEAEEAEGSLQHLQGMAARCFRLTPSGPVHRRLDQQPKSAGTRSTHQIYETAFINRSKAFIATHPVTWHIKMVVLGSCHFFHWITRECLQLCWYSILFLT